MSEPSGFDSLRLLCPACRSPLTVEGNGASCAGCGRAYAGEPGIMCLVAGGVGIPGFDPHYFETLSAVEEEHFWFVARRQVILDALRRAVPDLGERPLFDIGCGTGGLVSFLAR